MATTNRLFQDFISFVTDADPGSGGTSLSAPGLADLLVVASPDFVALTLDPEEEFGAPEIVWVSAHSSSATTATIVRAQEGTGGIAHAVGTQVVVGVTQDALDSYLKDKANLGLAGEVPVHDHTSGAQAGLITLQPATAISIRMPGGGQSLSDGVLTDVDYDTLVKESDPDSVLSANLGTGKITILGGTKPGWYMATASVNWSTAVTPVGQRRLVMFQSGGSADFSIEAVVGANPGANTRNIHQFSKTAFVDDTVEVQVEAQHTQGASLTISGGSVATFSIVFLGSG